MTWILVAAVGLLLVVVLAVVVLRLWRRTKALARSVKQAGELVEQASAVMATLPTAAPGAAGRHASTSRPPARRGSDGPGTPSGA